MLLTNKKYPILPMLKSGSLDGCAVLKRDIPSLRDDKHHVNLTWATYHREFNRRVRLISAPFMQSYDLAKVKLISDDLFEAIQPQSGTFLFGEMAQTFHVENIGGDIHVKSFLFHRDTLMAFCDTHMAFASDRMTDTLFWQSQKIPDDRSLEDRITSYIGELFLLLNFFKYAPVETKHLPANKRVKGIDCKYVNQTNSDIEYVNSTWFTNLVKSDGFKVRGHFRLQPCGQGRSERKLIWISDFEKEGYTAPARKLKEFGEQPLTEVSL